MKKLKISVAVLLSLMTLFTLLSCKDKTPADTNAEVIYYTVSFSTAGGSQVPEQRVLKDGYAQMPENPTRDGYIFSRWVAGGKEWNFDTQKITSDITLSAEWIDAGTVYSYENVGEGVAITGVKRNLDIMDVPSVIGGLRVIAIGDEAFAGTDAGKTSRINVAASVVTVGKNAFRDCEDVEINVGGALIGIGEGAFLYCNKLERITLGEGLREISFQAFGSCSSLKTVVMPDSVTVINESAFEDCTSLVEVTLGSSLVTVDNSAFARCDALDKVKYNGTEAEFDKITVEKRNDALKSADIIFLKD